jgi:anion-transporting  ArsA/GET3 family ATPase
MERLYEIHNEGDYDLIVVDTPPTRNALDFLDAPQRMADFFSSRLLRWLIVPYRSRMVNFASRPFYQVADRILGTQFLADIAEFFILFQSMYDGFVERAESVTRLLSDRRTTFMVVSTLEVTPVREAEFFASELVARKLSSRSVRRASSTSAWWPGARRSSGRNWGPFQRCWRRCRSSTPTSATWRGCCGWASRSGAEIGVAQA